MKRSDRLEAITVCIGMDDFLHETAKWNPPHFDEWIIITEPQDEKTREVCRKFNLKCILSEDGKRHGKPFNKGRLIERALQHTSADAWRLHLDCDVALPHGTRHLIQLADLHEDTIYGADRIDCFSWEQWKKLESTGYMDRSHDYHCRINVPRGFSLGGRWAHPKFGYVPIGFFQLWHSSQDEWRGIRTKSYSHAHNTACRTDVQFAMLWDRHKRGLVPELIVAHLMSEKAKNGINWNGRKTKRFGEEWCRDIPEKIGS